MVVLAVIPEAGGARPRGALLHAPVLRDWLVLSAMGKSVIAVAKRQWILF